MKLSKLPIAWLNKQSQLSNIWNGVRMLRPNSWFKKWFFGKFIGLNGDLKYRSACAIYWLFLERYFKYIVPGGKMKSSQEHGRPVNCSAFLPCYVPILDGHMYLFRSKILLSYQEYVYSVHICKPNLFLQNLAKFQIPVKSNY